MYYYHITPLSQVGGTVLLLLGSTHASARGRRGMVDLIIVYEIVIRHAAMMKILMASGR